MNLCSDLSRLIRGQFDEHGISYGRSMALDRLVARYFEMNIRLIHPVPRQVHFSDQTYASLGKLSRRGKDDPSAGEAWTAVFRLRQLHVEGADVNAFLSRNIRSARGWDGLLWNYGMHHFHLGRETKKDGFVKRSRHLLFAIVATRDVYFVDIRPHPPPNGVEWVNQELLRIVHSNWPEFIEANVLQGVRASEPTDEEMHELRRKNVNYPMNIDGKAIAPLRGEMAGDGSSVHCTLQAGGLLRDLQYHEGLLRSEEVRHAVAGDMRAQGFDIGPPLEFELVFLEDLARPPGLLAALTSETCISRDLCRRGFAVVEKKTRSPIAINDTALAKPH